MEHIPICMIGCGGMGRRHVRGYQQLAKSGIGNLDLIAVCDIRPENAERVADEAAELLGKRPMVFFDAADALKHPDIVAVDIVTEVALHHQLAIQALEAGKHTLLEKPFGLTIRACQAIIDAGSRAGVTLATAENYRRDPPNRLVRAILDAGLVGDPILMVETLLGGGNAIALTPWRHLKDKGAMGLDTGVHNADIIRYFMGDYEWMFGVGLIAEPTRYRPGADAAIFHRDVAAACPETMEATGEDSVLAMYRMHSGAIVQLSIVWGGGGRQRFSCSIQGRDGAIDLPRERTGQPVVLHLDGRELSGKEILPLLPEFQLDEITERLFGADGVAYQPPDRPQSHTFVDFKHLAIEFHDFGAAVLGNRSPEVDGAGGMAAVAAILGVYESALAGRPVRMQEVLSGEVCAYQTEIDAGLGL